VDKGISCCKAELALSNILFETGNVEPFLRDVVVDTGSVTVVLCVCEDLCIFPPWQDDPSNDKLLTPLAVLKTQPCVDFAIDIIGIKALVGVPDNVPGTATDVV